MMLSTNALEFKAATSAADTPAAPRRQIFNFRHSGAMRSIEPGMTSLL
jgi:hypothetical protein